MKTTSTISLRWKAAAVLLGVLALAPFFVGGAGATAFKATLALGAVGLTAAVGMRVRRRGAPTRVAPVQVVSRSNLNARVGVAVVEFEGRRLLVGYGDGFANVLATEARRGRRARKGA